MTNEQHFTLFVDQMPPEFTKFIIADSENIAKPRNTIFRSASLEKGSEIIKLVRENGCYNYKYIHNLYWKTVEINVAV
jgi:hypothetical protein